MQHGKTPKEPFRNSRININWLTPQQPTQYDKFASISEVWACNQTLANWGPNSKFVLKAIFKPLILKSSRSSIMITINITNYKS